jgi:2-oxoglutarate/2-oxoacid ferredoxin oxidoreductase subunit alpha
MAEDAHGSEGTRTAEEALLARIGRPRGGTPIELESLIIRFAGDSGDGMQLTGSEFSHTSAMLGNDVSTLPDYPAEIRAPAGTIAGVSGFQVNYAARDILTPGDSPNVLVVMNPAALAANIGDLEPGAVVIANSDAFTDFDLKKAGYEGNPLEDGSLNAYQLISVPISTLNLEAVKDVEGLDNKQRVRSQNFFALGLMFWTFDRPLNATLGHIDEKFAKKPAVAEANRRALRAGYNFGNTYEAFQVRFTVRPAHLVPGKYRQITGNEAIALGLVAASERSGKAVFYGGYPITPATDILHYLARYKNYHVRTFQAEDEIAAAGSIIGAAFGGALGVTASSGPGIALKAEAINLAIMTELPIVVIDVQRSGPSTGMPTKPEQSDLLQCMFGRNGPSPVVVIAPDSPAACFEMAMEAFRLAIRAMSPVYLLSDGFLANSAEPWRIPDIDSLPDLRVTHPTDPATFQPYARDPETLARPWAIPGTPGLEHRVGGLEKQNLTGRVTYTPLDHEEMVRVRAEKVARLADAIPDQPVFGPEEGDVLAVGWGGTCGSIRMAVRRAREEGKSVAHAQVRYLNPFPRNLPDILGRYRTILVPEMNDGQLAFLLRGRFALPNIVSLTKMQGRPFTIGEISREIDRLLATSRSQPRPPMRARTKGDAR